MIRKREREKIERIYRGNTRWKENCTFIKNVVVYLLIFADRWSSCFSLQRHQFENKNVLKLLRLELFLY